MTDACLLVSRKPFLRLPIPDRAPARNRVQRIHRLIASDPPSVHLIAYPRVTVVHGGRYLAAGPRVWQQRRPTLAPSMEKASPTSAEQTSQVLSSPAGSTLRPSRPSRSQSLRVCRMATPRMRRAEVGWRVPRQEAEAWTYRHLLAVVVSTTSRVSLLTMFPLCHRGAVLVFEGHPRSRGRTHVTRPWTGRLLGQRRPEKSQTSRAESSRPK